ncbi:ATP-NAD kinase family protein [Aliidiomarina haloalkalitolerans]|uniref:ATP-NAD kinase n=1 Tax=Aliidiomarina haloalkalitolerans TaxID=859059 RepID=A0A432VZ60_9GAMM|nr:ATP-NAD kinase family protein [Aliidiomarina haloalkalitolerans]RUO21945.1 ATP-NAD kinase [Aliidiomarina haloalkalitolerans]
MTTTVYTLALVINPYAGIGGAVALKGSDGAETRQQALARGAVPKANQRVAEALTLLQPYREQVRFVTASGAMGADLLTALGFEHEVLYRAPHSQTEADDTERAVQSLLTAQPDLLIFAGGDGTARDVYRALNSPAGQPDLPVLGIPAGVKIHSGVYAITPVAAGKVLEQLVTGQLTTLRAADVMDIDETAFRAGTVRARRYGEMQVPGELEYLQAVKIGGKESDELVLADIAADVIESMEDDAWYIMGSGSTVEFIMQELGLPNTLLGVDLIRNQSVVASDVTGAELEQWVAQAQAQEQPVYLVLTLIGGQGHVFGRGNQQLTPAVIRAVGRERFVVVASKSKLQQLNGRPLRVDTGDAKLDQELSGFIPVVTGYHDRTLMAITAI